MLLCAIVIPRYPVVFWLERRSLMPPASVTSPSAAAAATAASASAASAATRAFHDLA